MTAADSAGEKLGDAGDSAAAPNCKYSETSGENCRPDDTEGSRGATDGVAVVADSQATSGADSIDGSTLGSSEGEHSSRCNGIGGGVSFKPPPAWQISFSTGNSCSERTETSNGLVEDSISTGDGVIPEYGVLPSDDTQLERVGTAFKFTFFIHLDWKVWT
jgi:hypothetical protein